MGMAEPYIEETIIPTSIRVLAAIDQDPGIFHPQNFTEPLSHMMRLLEATRLVSCSIRFQECFQDRMGMALFRRQVCNLAEESQRALVSYSGPQWEPLCEGMFRRGDTLSLLRAAAKPLQGLAHAALPRAAPAGLGNLDSRFDFEAFFQRRSKVFLEHREAGIAPRPGSLRYPSAFAPGAACAPAPPPAPGGLDGPFDVAEALRRLGRHVPLSRFAINFGAADGECGAGADDWNADPANCLVDDGYSAIMVEGDPRWHGSLREKFGGRADVSLVLQFLPLENVTTLLRGQASSLPAFSSSPDLLKVDVDHSDCSFMKEALKVVSPKLMHLEYMPLAPPPLDYAQQYQPNLVDVRLQERRKPLLAASTMSSGYDPVDTVEARPEVQREVGGERPTGLELTGCSLAAFLSRAPGYEIAVVGDEEALLVRRDLHPLLEIGLPPSPWDAWVEGVLCHPMQGRSPGMYAWGFDWRALAAPELGDRERMALLDEVLRGHGANAFSLRSLEGLATRRAGA